ncbi:hypothetical protein PYCCODRAFT_1380531 [Trametes coccinea BRFM310]|uniref:DUF6533 domain-containing protein n=1 Tax=Trametes coccinea (strain BRFM310) TaxID=1353009 RepID=A0A1Y2J7C0_TRAC3|nr:hypothetical protein PYCCODRAFT_1380531 [Trametes coccinea BRFM310]
MWSESVQSFALHWAHSVRFKNDFSLAGLTILYYDYLLTLFDEIEFFWRSSNVTFVSVLFVIIRYLGLLAPIPVAIEYFADLSEIRCRRLETYHQAYAIASQAIVAIMLVIRTYALYERNKRILALLIVTHVGGGIFCLISIVTNTSPVKTSITIPFSFKGCNLGLTNKQGIHLALAWGAMLWFDTTIFVLTLLRALRMRRHLPGGLLEIMFRDGTVYYGIMVVANVSNTITFLITPPGSPMKGLDTTLTNVLSTTLTSRLILNLRDPKLQRPRRIDDSENNRRPSAWNVTSVPPISRPISFNAVLTEVLTFQETQHSDSEEGV